MIVWALACLVGLPGEAVTVSFDRPCVTLAEFTRELNAVTGWEDSVGDELAGESIALVVKDMEADELKAHVARVVWGTWEKGGGGERLVRDTARMEEEARFVRASKFALAESMREQARSALAGRSGVEDEGSVDPSLSALMHDGQVGGRALVTAIASLPLEAWADAWDQGKAVFSTEPTFLQRKLEVSGLEGLLREWAEKEDFYTHLFLQQESALSAEEKEVRELERLAEPPFLRTHRRGLIGEDVGKANLVIRGKPGISALSMTLVVYDKQGQIVLGHGTQITFDKERFGSDQILQDIFPLESYIHALDAYNNNVFIREDLGFVSHEIRRLGEYGFLKKKSAFDFMKGMMLTDFVKGKNKDIISYLPFGNDDSMRFSLSDDIALVMTYHYPKFFRDQVVLIPATLNQIQRGESFESFDTSQLDKRMEGWQDWDLESVEVFLLDFERLVPESIRGGFEELFPERLKRAIEGLTIKEKELWARLMEEEKTSLLNGGRLYLQDMNKVARDFLVRGFHAEKISVDYLPAYMAYDPWDVQAQCHCGFSGQDLRNHDRWDEVTELLGFGIPEGAYVEAVVTRRTGVALEEEGDVYWPIGLDEFIYEKWGEQGFKEKLGWGQGVSDETDEWEYVLFEEEFLDLRVVLVEDVGHFYRIPLKSVKVSEPFALSCAPARFVEAVEESFGRLSASPIFEPRVRLAKLNRARWN